MCDYSLRFNLTCLKHGETGGVLIVLHHGCFVTGESGAVVAPVAQDDGRVVP